MQLNLKMQYATTKLTYLGLNGGNLHYMFHIELRNSNYVTGIQYVIKRSDRK